MEILSQEDIMTIEPSCAKAIIGFGIAFLFMALVSVILCSFSDMAAQVVFGAALISGIITIFLIIGSSRVDSGRNKYEVKLDETIDINEFYDEYEVIERRDKIWVIEDREAKDDANS